MKANIIYGLIFTLVGVLTILAIKFNNQRFIFRLNNYRRLFGYKLGTIIHYLLYAVIPISLGLYFFLFR